MNWIDLILKNRFLVVIATIMIASWGILSLGSFSVDAIPDMTDVQIQINSDAGSLSPIETEQTVTVLVEQALMGLPQVEEVRSLSKYGLSQVTIVFEEGVDIYFARQLVSQRLQQLEGELPEGVTPEMGPIATGLGEIYLYELKGDERYSLLELREIQDWVVKKQLLAVPGVTEVNSFGGLEKQYEIHLGLDRLRQYQLTFGDVYEAIHDNNQNVGGGIIESQGEQYIVRGVGRIKDLKELEQRVVQQRGGRVVTLSEIAEVKLGGKIRQGAVTRDGRGDIVAGIVMMLVDENSRAVTTRVDKKIQEIQKSLPPGVQIETFYNRTELVDATIQTVAKNLIEGALLVIFVLFLFLGNFRIALLVATVIPISMLTAVILMNHFGITGNLMSLGAIDFGLLVDGSVVMVEYILAKTSVSNEDESAIDIVRSAGREVLKPVLFGVGIITIVYLPILTLTGMEGKMFFPMAITVVFALLASLVLAVTYVPAVASLVLKKHKEKPHWLFSRLNRLYLPSLERSLRYPWLSFTLGTLVFAVSLFFGSRLGGEFLPNLNEGSIAIQIIRHPNISLEESNKIQKLVEKKLLSFKEVSTAVSRTGRPDIATDPMGVNISDMIVGLKPEYAWHKDGGDLVRRMRDSLEKIPGIQTSFSQPIALRVAELVAGVRADVAIKVYGESEEVDSVEFVEELTHELSKISGAVDVQMEQVSPQPYLSIEVDPIRAGRYGFTVKETLDAISFLLGEAQVGEIFRGERKFPIVFKLQASYLEKIEDLKSLRLTNDEGQVVELSQLADIEMRFAPVQISRESGQRRMVISANVEGRDMVGFVEEAKKKLGAKLKPGFFFDWGGEFENYQRASDKLKVVVPLTLAVILILLYMNFSSFPPAILIFLNVPLATSGGLLLLWLRGMPFSISAGVGFIALSGIAVLNGLVLVSHLIDEKDRRRDLALAVKEGALHRLRPVLTTAVVAGLGFVPMATASGAGAEVQAPLATVVIGGLFTSTFLTLYIIPGLFLWWYGGEKNRE